MQLHLETRFNYITRSTRPSRFFLHRWDGLGTRLTCVAIILIMYLFAATLWAFSIGLFEWLNMVSNLCK